MNTNEWMNEWIQNIQIRKQWKFVEFIQYKRKTHKTMRMDEEAKEEEREEEYDERNLLDKQ